MTSSEISSNPLAIVLAFVRSSIGAKVIMAVTGFLLWGFIIVHLLSNLTIFIPPAMEKSQYFGQSLNEYAHFLKTTPAILWGGRAGLLGLAILHVVLGLRLAALNRAARPMGYVAVNHKKSTWGSRTMPITGLIVLAYLLFHLAHFTFGWIDREAFTLLDVTGKHDVANMVRRGFSDPVIVGFYLLGNGLLILHLFHGSQSLWQSIGLQHPDWRRILALGGRAVVILILIGNFAIPLVVFGWHLQSQSFAP